MSLVAETYGISVPAASIYGAFALLRFEGAHRCVPRSPSLKASERLCAVQMCTPDARSCALIDLDSVCRAAYK